MLTRILRRDSLSFLNALMPMLELMASLSTTWIAYSGLQRCYTCTMFWAKSFGQRPMDYSSRNPHLHIEDIQSSSITITREELSLALHGANCEVHEVKEEFKIQLRMASQASIAKAFSSHDLKREIKLLNMQLRQIETQLTSKPWLTSPKHK